MAVPQGLFTVYSNEFPKDLETARESYLQVLIIKRVKNFLSLNVAGIIALEQLLSSIISNVSKLNITSKKNQNNKIYDTELGIKY